MTQIKGRACGDHDLSGALIEDVTGSRTSHVQHIEYVLDMDWHDYLAAAIRAAGITLLPRWLAVAKDDLAALPTGDYGTLGARLENGVRIRPTNYKNFGVLRPFHIDVSEEQKRTVIGAALAHIGDSYCVRNIFGDFLHINVERPHAEVCSEFFVMTANLARIVQNPIDGVGLMSPRDVVMSPTIVLD